ncbi:hypothetical protein EUGRSUZ_C00795 [Eucalyptus grandis]|uniref:Uncharacterized protein n=2 Tax=Eucalyptus grandis TaxID=71139 RepID=A0ACC3LBL2_EUCGR|nr:hypothetical protein EUGRSUZ_C00795 [Eucalyptus grandis]
MSGQLNQGRERQHVDAIPYGLVHGGKYVGAHAARFPAYFIAGHPGLGSHAPSDASCAAEQAGISHWGACGGARRVSPMSIMVPKGLHLCHVTTCTVNATTLISI